MSRQDTLNQDNSISAFLASVSQAEAQASEAATMPSRPLMETLLGSLIKVRRVEYAVDVAIDPGTQKEEVEWTVSKEYCVCPVCLEQMRETQWIDVGSRDLRGPYCSGCLKNAHGSMSHEDGMTYGSRVYALGITSETLKAMRIMEQRGLHHAAPKPVKPQQQTPDAVLGGLLF